LRLARRRAEGMLVELGADDLAMTPGEATLLLRRAGLALDAREITTLMRSTEGWPMGLALAGVAIGEQHRVGAAVAGFAGDDRLVAEYLQDELLAQLAPDEREFVTLTSPLTELSGPLCD